MNNKINSCSDIELSKINLNCCDNEIASIQEAGPLQSLFFATQQEELKFKQS